MDGRKKKGQVAAETLLVRGPTQRYLTGGLHQARPVAPLICPTACVPGDHCPQEQRSERTILSAEVHT